MSASPQQSPVYAYRKNPSMVDFPGRWAAIFFIAGCNFKCGFCHNAELMGKPLPGLSWARLSAGCDKFKSNWVDGAVITGGEPTLLAELLSLISFLRRFGWRVKLDTNGSRPDALKKCLPLVDYIAMDIKAGESGYRALTGWSDLASLRRSVDLIKLEAKDYEFRTTVIEQFHTDRQMDEIAEMVRGARRYAMQAFVPSDELPDASYRSMPRTSPDRLNELVTRMSSCAEEVLLRGE